MNGVIVVLVFMGQSHLIVAPDVRSIDESHLQFQWKIIDQWKRQPLLGQIDDLVLGVEEKVGTMKEPLSMLWMG